MSEAPPSTTSIQRQHTRRKVKLAVEIRDSRGSKMRAAICDISENGCAVSIEAGLRMKIGQTYCLKVKGLEIQAGCAAWSTNGEAGFVFETPLSGYVVDHLASSAA